MVLDGDDELLLYGCGAVEPVGSVVVLAGSSVVVHWGWVIRAGKISTLVIRLLDRLLEVFRVRWSLSTFLLGLFGLGRVKASIKT